MTMATTTTTTTTKPTLLLRLLLVVVALLMRPAAGFLAPTPLSASRSFSPRFGAPAPASPATLPLVPHPQPTLTTPRGRRSSSSSFSRRLSLALHAIPPALAQDLGGATLVGLASALWLKIWTTLATSGKVDSKDSRKLIHCGSGPLFMLCWPFFSADPSARFYAAAVPLLQIVAVVASGLAKQQPNADPSSSSSTSSLPSTTPPLKKKPSGLVAAISRSGNPAEVLRGPLIYVVILLLSTVLFWRTNVVGLVAVSQMAAGDGMADIVGRRFGQLKWPFSNVKSYAGTGAFALFGFLVSVGLIGWFNWWGLVPALTVEVVGRVGLISVLCALVELVPLGDDNITVPVVASGLAYALLL